MENKDVAEQNDELYKIATNIFSERFVPIFLMDYRRIPKHFGSGCLININNKNYLVTAAHSLMPEKGSEDERGIPCIAIDKNIVFRIEDFAYSMPNAEGINKYDIAVAPLDEGINNRLFLPAGRNRKAIYANKIFPVMPRENLLCVCGFQYSKNRFRASGGPIMSKATSYAGYQPGLDVYQSLNLRPDEHLLIDFPTAANSKGQTPGAPGGVSGGPVFAYGAGKDNWRDVQYGLAGIVTNHLIARNLFKATNIGMVLKLLAKYDNVASKGKIALEID